MTLQVSIRHRHSCPWKDQNTPTLFHAHGPLHGALGPQPRVLAFVPSQSHTSSHFHLSLATFCTQGLVFLHLILLAIFKGTLCHAFILHRVRTALPPAHSLLWTLNLNIILHPQHQLPSCGAVLGFAQPWLHVVLNHLARPIMALAVLIDNYSCGTRCAGW